MIYKLIEKLGKKLHILAFLIFLPLTFSVCEAANYYVAPPPAGNDQGAGTVSSPWGTIQHAVNNAAPGDTILVADGLYSPFEVAGSGTPTNPITVRAEGNNVRINGYDVFDGRYTAISVVGDYVTIEGFKIDVGAVDSSVRSRGIRVSGFDGDHVLGVVIKNNTIKNAGWVGITTSFAEGVRLEGNDVSYSKGQHGIYVANSADYPVIRNNKVYGNDEAGIQINADANMGGDGIVTGALIENNILYGNGLNGSGAIEMDGVENSIIRNNLIYDNKTTGINNYRIDAASPCRNNKILNNTIVMPVGSRHGIALRHGATGATIYNNIIINLGSADSIAVDADSISGLKSDYNVITRIEDTSGGIISFSAWQSIYGQDLNSFTATESELFENPAASDYRLKGAGKAVDAGIVLSDVTTDIVSIQRPQGQTHDLGAYEFSNLSDAIAPSSPYNLIVQ